MMTPAAAWRRLRRRPHGIYHVRFPTMKHVENSIRGVLHAIANWFARIDLDLSITKADPHCPARYHPDGQPCRGHVVGCHWPYPMKRDRFRDPLGLIHADTPIYHMTLEEALRLEAVDRHATYHIWMIEDLLKACGGHWPGDHHRGAGKIIALLEPKGDPRFNNTYFWNHINAVARQWGVRWEAYATKPNRAALPFAKVAGADRVWVIGG